MRLARLSLASFLITALLILVTSVAYAADVVVDVAASSAKSSTGDIDPGKVVKKGEQIGLLISSTILTPQKVTLKFNGLSQESYDLYVNGEYTTKVSRQVLEQGYLLPISGTIADPDMMRCLKSLQPKIEPVYKELNQSSESERKRVSYTLGQAKDWVRSGIRNESLYRSAFVMLAPADRAVQSMNYSNRQNDIETARTITRACWLLQQARDRMYDVIEDPEVRNLAVTTLTPVELSGSCTVQAGKLIVKAKVANSCDLPISGNITLATPKGWKIKSGSSKFQGIKAGKTYEAKFVLISLQKNNAIPKSLEMSSTIKVVQDDLVAQFKLTTDMPAGAPAPK